MVQITPQILYRTASILYAVSAPGHVQMGFASIYKSIRSIPSSADLAVGKQGARNCWDYVTGSLIVMALLNNQWCRTDGPTSAEEQAIALVALVAGFWSAWGYVKVGSYSPLGCLVVAPVCSVLGMALS